MPTGKHDWKKIVSESNGTRAFLPDGFKKQMDELEVKRKEFNADMVKAAKREIAMQVANNNLYLAIREHFEKQGYPDIWVKDIGFDANALEEGTYILNINSKQA